MAKTVALKTTRITVATAVSMVTTDLKRIDPRYSARFVPAEDETVDDSIEILLDGKESGWAIQLGPDYACINRFVEAEEAFYHYDQPSLAAAIARLPAIIRAN